MSWLSQSREEENAVFSILVCQPSTMLSHESNYRLHELKWAAKVNLAFAVVPQIVEVESVDTIIPMETK